MPQSIEAWSQQQWGVFVAVLAAGLLAMLLAPVAVRVRADVRAVGAVMMPLQADDVAEHLAAGPGSLVSLREVGPGSIAPAEHLVDDDIRAEIGSALDAALESFRVAVEPAMRTARLWTLRGGESYAENALRVWHIMEQTGEWPMVSDGAGA